MFFLRSKMNIYKQLSKSGIVLFVMMSAAVGYILGHNHETVFCFKNFFLMLFGLCCTASGSSALNQLQEIRFDQQMERTKNRPLVKGDISRREAIFFIILCFLIGLTCLIFIHIHLFALAICSIIFYNGFYTLWWKRELSYAAIPGALPGALPILIGWVAAGNAALTPKSFYLFMILFFWQMPHFWSLAMKYQQEYALVGFPTLPVTHGTTKTIQSIFIWCLGYMGLLIISPFFFKMGIFGFASIVLLCGKIFYELLLFTKKDYQKSWLRFFLWVNFSLVIFFIIFSLEAWKHQLFKCFLSYIY